MTILKFEYILIIINWIIYTLIVKFIIFNAKNDSIILTIDNVVTNPEFLSFDNETEVLWAANHNTLFLFAKNGTPLGSLTGFKNITAISSGLGFCWVADGLLQKVFLIDGDVTSNRTIEELSATEFSRDIPDPVDIVMVRGAEPMAMVAEYSSGSIIKLDELGNEVFRISGMNLPRKIAINQDY